MFFRRALAVLALLTSALLAACGSDSNCADGARCADGPRRDATAMDTGTDSGGPTSDVPGLMAATDIIALEIDPMNMSILSNNGMPVMQPYRLFSVQRDGRRVLNTNGAWSLDTDRLGAIAAD